MIIAIAAIMLSTYYVGLSAGQKQARQECIEKVSENCEYICGVGADFFFPDQEKREFNDIEDPDEQEIRVAQRRYPVGLLEDYAGVSFRGGSGVFEGFFFGRMPKKNRITSKRLTSSS